MDELTPAQASALSLLLRHGQSYEDVGQRLRIDPLSVRVRAHEAVAVLAGVDPVTDPALLDRALGQLPPAEVETRGARLDHAEDAGTLDLLTEALASFLGPAARPAPPPLVSEPAVVLREPAVAPVEPLVLLVEPAVVPSEPTVADGGGPLSPVADSAIVRTARARPRARRSQRRAVSARMGAMLSLGLGFVAAGGVLFINGAH